MKRIVLAAALVAFGPGSSFAMYRTTAMQIQATVQPAVTFTSIQAMNFGSVVAGQSSDKSARIVLTASSGLACRITLDGGLYATTTGRFMRDTTTQLQSLAYSLYSDAAHTVLWGDDGITIAGASVPYVGAGQRHSAVVYGRLQTSVSVPEGDYADTVTITVYY